VRWKRYECLNHGRRIKKKDGNKEKERIGKKKGKRFPAGAENSSPHHRVLNGSWTHPASYPMGTRGSFPGDKEAGARS
jgi:hypothetical protein